jgi:hypothetical protein
MATDYIPASDAEFDAWQQNLVNYVVANAATLGVSPAEVTSIQGFNGSWGTKYPASSTATAAANAATQEKNDCRSDYEGFPGRLRIESVQPAGTSGAVARPSGRASDSQHLRDP